MYIVQEYIKFSISGLKLNLKIVLFLHYISVKN